MPTRFASHTRRSLYKGRFTGPSANSAGTDGATTRRSTTATGPLPPAPSLLVSAHAVAAKRDGQPPKRVAPRRAAAPARPGPWSRRGRDRPRSSRGRATSRCTSDSVLSEDGRRHSPGLRRGDLRTGYADDQDGAGARLCQGPGAAATSRSSAARRFRVRPVTVGQLTGPGCPCRDGSPDRAT